MRRHSGLGAKNVAIYFIHGVDDVPATSRSQERLDLYERRFRETVGRAIGYPELRLKPIAWGALRPKVNGIKELRHSAGLAHSAGGDEAPSEAVDAISLSDLTGPRGLNIVATIEALCFTLEAAGRADDVARFRALAEDIAMRDPEAAIAGEFHTWEQALEAIDAYVASAGNGVDHSGQPKLATLRGAVAELLNPKGSLTRNMVATFIDPKWMDQAWYWGAGRSAVSRLVSDVLAPEFEAASKEPLILLAHSHGGAVILDALNSEPLTTAVANSSRRACLAIVGSQLGVFRDLSLVTLHGGSFLKPEISQKLRWRNFYDRRDPFTFPGGEEDAPFASGMYFHWAHTEYFASVTTYIQIKKLVDEVLT